MYSSINSHDNTDWENMCKYLFYKTENGDDFQEGWIHWQATVTPSARGKPHISVMINSSRGEGWRGWKTWQKRPSIYLSVERATVVSSFQGVVLKMCLDLINNDNLKPKKMSSSQNLVFLFSLWCFVAFYHFFKNTQKEQRYVAGQFVFWTLLQK